LTGYRIGLHMAGDFGRHYFETLKSYSFAPMTKNDQHVVLHIFSVRQFIFTGYHIEPYVAGDFWRHYLGTLTRYGFVTMTKNDQHVLLHRKPAGQVSLTGYHFEPYMAGDFRRQYLGTLTRYGFSLMTKNDPHYRLPTFRHSKNDFCTFFEWNLWCPLARSFEILGQKAHGDFCSP